MARPGERGVLIVGGGAAGTACAEELRGRGYDGPIVLAARDPDPPYERPPVSKEYLRGEAPAAPLHVPADVDLRTRTSVLKLDVEARSARLSAGEPVRYDSALLAPGANVRRLRFEGAQLGGIHYLRALGNADALRADAADAERVVLVGGSYIACEVAASLTALGHACTLVMLEEAPLTAHFSPAVGAFFAALLRERGIELVTADGVERFEGDDRVRRVTTASGRALAADLVVMGTGAVPDVLLARASGLALGETGGIACSAALATSADGVWAAGDACEYDSLLHRRRARVEHWEVARAQGRHAAAAMLGEAAPYEEVPYFWSDMADWCTLEALGPVGDWDGEAVRGAYADGRFCTFFLAGGRIVGALSVGRPEDLEHARALMRAGADLGPRAGALLADEATDLSSLWT